MAASERYGVSMRILQAWSVVIFAVVALPSVAQVERSGAKGDVRVMQQLQQVTSERASLQAENGKLQQEIEQLKKDNAKLTAAKGTLEGRAKALEIAANRASRSDDSDKQTQEQLERTRAQLQELVAKFRETAQALRDVETERSATKGKLVARERDLQVCVDRNAGLYNLNADVLDRMEHRGLWSALAENEPFTRLKRVELENIADDYKFRANELRIEQQQAKSSR